MYNVSVSKRYLQRFVRKFLPRINIGGEIEPDQIFLDSSNLPNFDTYQFEGRLEKSISRRTFFFLSMLFLLVAVVFAGRMWFLQVKSGEAYALRSESNHLRHTNIFADRGIIYDRLGVKLAWNELNENGDYALRKYSDKGGFSHLLGFVKYPAKDKQGIYYEENFTPKGGVEEYYDSELRGRNGLKITETDALGNIQSESVLTGPTDGKDISLSIDERIQAKFYELIATTVAERKFLGGAGVIMDINTGEIIAVTNYPEFDLNLMTAGEDKERIEKLLSSTDNPFLNRAIGGQFTPGSIMKPFIAMGALEEKIIDPLKEINSTGSISVPNPYDPTKKTIFHDWRVNGWTDMRHAIAASSNVYFFSVGGGYDGQKGIGIDNIGKYTKIFGFGEETGIDLFGEKEGNVPSRAWKIANFKDGEWRLGDTYNSSIGQYGFLTTPIQALRAMTAIANSGRLLTPTVRLNNFAVQKKFDTLKFSPEYWKIVREGLRLSVAEGTAKGLFMPEISVAAKTGTAELGASKAQVNSWVLGYFPYETPRYAFVVLMEKGPRENQIGAISIMRGLFEYMYAYTPEYIR